MAETESNNKRVRVDSDESPESDTESPESKRLRVDFFDILDDTDTADDRTDDLATVMKSLEEEISLSLPPPPASASDSGESQPDLGYLLEASDDELGLPPTTSSCTEAEESVDILRGPSEAVGFDQIWGFEDEIPGYDALGFGIVESNENEDEPYVLDGGLFHYSDADCGLSDFSEFPWRPESLPAL